MLVIPPGGTYLDTELANARGAVVRGGSLGDTDTVGATASTARERGTADVLDLTERVGVVDVRPGLAAPQRIHGCRARQSTRQVIPVVGLVALPVGEVGSPIT